MPKIQNVGVGKYIRSEKHYNDVLQVAANDGNAFLCYPVVGRESSRVIVDTKKYFFIPLDSDVQQVTLT